MTDSEVSISVTARGSCARIPPTKMKRTKQCPKCASSHIIVDAMMIDRGNNSGEITVATYRRPHALVFKGTQETTVSAWVCADCGYLELYADQPSDISTIE